jgi:hypothetical protein
MYKYGRIKYQKRTNSLQVQLVNTCGTFNVIRQAVGLMGKNEPDSDNQVITRLTH